MNGDEIDDAMQQAERIADAPEDAQRARAMLHRLVDIWPSEGLGILVRAVNQAQTQLPDEWLTGKGQE